MITISEPIRFAQIWLGDPGRRTAEVDFASDEVAVGASPSGIRIGCLNPGDGETVVSICRDCDDVPAREPDFVFELDTPSRRVEVTDSEESFIVSVSVTDIRTSVSVWMNHPKESDEIALRLASAGRQP